MAGTNAGNCLVVGADGQIGRALCRQLSEDGRSVVGTSRRNAGNNFPLNLADTPESWQLASQPKIDVAFLCAAITSIERCQAEPAGTRVINVDRTLELARQLHDRGAHLVFLSTNQVFDGSVASRSECDPVCPRTEYGRQKADVETKLLEWGNAAIVRLTKVVWPEWKLIRDWTAALRRGEPIAAFHDMVMAPVPLAFAIQVLQKIGAQQATGIFQVSGEKDLSYFEAALKIANRLGVSPELVRSSSIASRNMPLESAPAHSALDTNRVSRVLGLECPLVGPTLDELIEPDCTRRAA